MLIPADIPENLLIKSYNRSWSNVLVDVTDYSCDGQVIQRLPHEDKLRLSVLLEEVGRYRCEPREKPDVPCVVKPRDMSIIPAGMPLFGYSADVRFAKVAHIVFDEALLEKHEITKNLSVASTPRLRFADDRVWTLVKLLSEAMQDADPSSQLYGDSLITAIVARLLDQTKPSTNVGLSDLQLRDAIGFLDAQLPNRVDLATLASLAGLSKSHYCRAFKASTGMAPYQWQLNERIERAKCLLLDTRHSMDDIAEVTGFADAAHFGRTFRRITGATPALWRTHRLT
ncbi:AraC family transcriptional regulator [Paucibacter sp. M5-1]|uniref:AraC family transcriptional regulator n=1 Tax=Paucibacter sp. M5-1 TaxID=3015998 RepID=UPI0022B8F8B6|nr:AraC family transcriptional regulator [Paucibacter sp. M5-1]MCZ7880614.1 AraC family transcriptional regulator [Paucibacter sp. M5-1]